MNEIYSGYEIELNKEEDKAYKAKILKIEGNSYQETRDEVAGTTVSGDFISISDAQDLPITKFNIEGKSVQETREGYNHFNAGNLNLTNTTQMSQNWQNDVLTVTSAGLPFALASQNITDLVKNNPGETLTFDFEDITFTQLDKTKSSPIQMNIYFSDGTATKYYGIVDYQKIKHPYTIPTDTSNISSVLICVYSWNGTGDDSEFTTTVTKPMLYLGTESKPYERYGKTPSIEFKAPVESVGDNINLLQNTGTTKTINGITFTVNEDGTILVNGTATANASFNFEEAFKDYPIGTYKLSGCPSGGASNTYRLISWKEGYSVNAVDIGNSTQVTFDGTTKYRTQIVIASGVTANNLLFKPKLVKGTKSTPYSPYGQGSIEIYNVNKNLFDGIAEQGALNADGWTADSTTRVRMNKRVLLKKGTYTINANGSEQVAVYFYNDTTTKAESNSGWVNTPYTFTITTDKYICGAFRKANNSEVTINNINNIQIEKGSTATEFLEHQAQTKALYTQQPFRGREDVVDGFVEKALNWYEQHKIEEIIFNGTEYWENPSNIGEDFLRFHLTRKYKKDSILFCDKLEVVPNSNWKEEKEKIEVDETFVHITIAKSRLTTQDLNGFKNFLNSNNITVYHELETPTLIECTPEQVEVLESMRTYEGVNHIYTTDELKPTISLRYNYIPALPSIEAESLVRRTGDNTQLFDKKTVTSNHYILDSTGSLTASKVSSTSDYIEVVAGETYSLIYDYRTLQNITPRAICFFDKDKKYLSGHTYSPVNRQTQITPTRQGYVRFCFDNDVYDIKFFKGKELGVYSKYGEDAIDIYVRNANYINTPKNTRVEINGLTIDVDNEGIMTFNGKSTASMYLSLIDYFETVNTRLPQMKLTQGIYTLSFERISGTADSNNMSLYLRKNHNNEENSLQIIRLPTTSIFSVTDKILQDDLYVNYLWIYKEITFNNFKVRFQLEKNNTKTSMKPSEKAIIKLPIKQPIGAIENMKDCFIKQNDIWYENRPIFRKIFNGTESIGILNEYATKHINTFLFSFKLPDGKEMPGKNAPVLCNRFKHDKDLWNTDIEGVASTEKNRIEFSVNKDRFKGTTTSEAVKEFKEMLLKLYNEGTPLIIETQLENPQIIPCTAVQSMVLDRLQNIQLYDGENLINTTIIMKPMLTLDFYNSMKDFDAYISTDGYFEIPGTDIKFRINPIESSLPTMPEAVEASVRAAGRDGDYVLNTTYEPLPFEIVCYTEDNLTPTQKKEIESKVNRFLNSIKNRTKRIAFEKGEKFYNVKYNGLLTTTNYPAHLKFSIPLKSSESFGKDAYQKVLSGNSTEVSDTVEEVGALITIYGPATLPIIALNDYSMEYDTAILEGARVEIDTAKSTATHINSDGVKTNVMRYYNHQFPKIQPGENTLKVLSGVDDENNVTVKWNDLKL